MSFLKNIRAIPQLNTSLDMYVENFYQDDITISSLADISHLLKFHFIRVFKNIYGKNPTYKFNMRTIIIFLKTT